MRNALVLLSLLALLPGCDQIHYARTRPGTLEGKLEVEWIGPDEFIFHPDPRTPLKFTRSNGEVIQPGEMYTDGGSIPYAMRIFRSFSPWGYAPAFIVHDWLFDAHHCGDP